MSRSCANWGILSILFDHSNGPEARLRKSEFQHCLAPKLYLIGSNYVLLNAGLPEEEAWIFANDKEIQNGLHVICEECYSMAVERATLGFIMAFAIG